MKAIFMREMKSYFTSMMGWVVIFVFYVLAGFSFVFLTLITQSSDLTDTFSFLLICALVTTPILTMRLISEEKRQKTDQLLLTAPIRLSAIVLGKYFAALVVYVCCIFSTIIFAVTMGVMAPVEWATLLLTLLGILLAGMALVSIGIFMSSITESQIIALIGTFGVMIFILLIMLVQGLFQNEIIRTAISAISFFDRYSSFTTGILNISDILFFISVAAVFNFLTVRVLEKKRWS